MNEINNYKYMFFKKLYDSLNLKEMEQRLENENIRSLNVISSDKYEPISNYFFLLNEVNIERLSQEQLQDFHLYFSKDINMLTKEEEKKINGFIDETYSIVLFPDVDSKYVYYGPINDNYISPKDAITIGLYYNVFGDYDDFEVENKLADIINYIQFDLAKKINKKVSVIPFNQITLEYRSNSFSK